MVTQSVSVGAKSRMVPRSVSPGMLLTVIVLSRQSYDGI